MGHACLHTRKRNEVRWAQKQEQGSCRRCVGDRVRIFPNEHVCEHDHWLFIGGSPSRNAVRCLNNDTEAVAGTLKSLRICVEGRLLVHEEYYLSTERQTV